MKQRLLTPDQTPPTIISLTRTNRWLSVIRQQSKHDHRIAALDWNDLATECRRWPGSVAIVEVDQVNLQAACRFPTNWAGLLAGCGLFAVTSLPSPEVSNLLAVAGYAWSCRSPLAAERLFRQIRRFQSEQPATSTTIDAAFRQRLPWKTVARYAEGSFKRTRFSTLPTQSAETSDSLAQAKHSND